MQFLKITLHLEINKNEEWTKDEFIRKTLFYKRYKMWSESERDTEKREKQRQGHKMYNMNNNKSHSIISFFFVPHDIKAFKRNKK